jgi:hypothetical protein
MTLVFLLIVFVFKAGLMTLAVVLVASQVLKAYLFRWYFRRGHWAEDFKSKDSEIKALPVVMKDGDGQNRPVSSPVMKQNQSDLKCAVSFGSLTRYRGSSMDLSVNSSFVKNGISRISSGFTIVSRISSSPVEQIRHSLDFARDFLRSQVTSHQSPVNTTTTSCELRATSQPVSSPVNERQSIVHSQWPIVSSFKSSSIVPVCPAGRLRLSSIGVFTSSSPVNMNPKSGVSLDLSKLDFVAVGTDSRVYKKGN